MSGWSERELLLIGAANEIIIAPERGDSTPRPAVPIWVVRVGDELYVRSYRGPSGGWYRRAVSAATVESASAFLSSANPSPLSWPTTPRPKTWRHSCP